MFGFPEGRSSKAQSGVQAAPRSTAPLESRDIAKALALENCSASSGCLESGEVPWAEAAVAGRGRQQRVLALARAGRKWSSKALRQAPPAEGTRLRLPG